VPKIVLFARCPGMDCHRKDRSSLRQGIQAGQDDVQAEKPEMKPEKMEAIGRDYSNLVKKKVYWEEKPGKDGDDRQKPGMGLRGSSKMPTLGQLRRVKEEE